jgi:hypothetical protein
VNILIQVTSLNGAIIEKARWGAENLSFLREGQSLYIDFQTDDEKLASKISGFNTPDCSVEADGENLIVTAHLRIKSIKHSFDPNSKLKKIETMITVVPSDRLVENILFYIYDQKLCDPKFLSVLRS